MDLIAKLQAAAQRRGLSVIERGAGHFQIVGGPLLVNYYPTSKRRSAYVAGTTEGKDYVTPEAAGEMAFAPPPIAINKAKRGRNSRQQRERMLRHAPYCHWCRRILTLDTSTLDHVIPLHRGGLDNANNRVLACEACNHERGHEMPELF